MEKVKILGVDPSLRHSGFATVVYDSETNEFYVENCHVINNPAKFKGTDAIREMLLQIEDLTRGGNFEDIDRVIVESPPLIFGPHMQRGAMTPVAHIAGGAFCLFGIWRGMLVRPSEWNGGKKKEKTHAKTIEILGDPQRWDYFQRVKNEKHLEHVLDAASMALWYIAKHVMI